MGETFYDAPHNSFGSLAARGPLSLEAKRFIVEMCERFTGKNLLE